MEIFQSSWIFLVAIVAAASSKCFHDRKAPYFRSFTIRNESVPIVLESSDRISHQITNHILKILLKEYIGYRNVKIVSRNDGVNLTNVLRRLSGCKGSRCRHLRSAVPETMVNIEAWKPVGFDSDPWTRSGGIVEAGPLGPFGRFGWYMPSHAVDQLRRSRHIYADHWRSLQSGAVTSKFSNYCYGTSCKTHRFGSAAVLLSSYRDFDQGILEKQIRNLHLNVDVSHVNSNLTRIVQRRTSSNLPTLFFSHVPSLLSVSGNYTRMKFPACDSNPSRVPQNCDFELHEMTKYVWSAIKTQAPLAYDLISHMTFTHEHYEAMLRNFSSSSSSSVSPENFACDWLKKNRDQWSSWIPQKLDNKTTIYIGGMFPVTGTDWIAPGIIPGAQMALDLVNQNTTLLKDYNLELEIKDTMCSPDVVMKGFISYITNTTHKFIGILGPACSDTAEPIAGVAKHYNFIIISYSVEALSLSNRQSYPFFFRTKPDINEYGNVYARFFKSMNWKRVGTIITDGNEYTRFHTLLQDVFKKNDIEIAQQTKLPHMVTNTTDLSQYLEDFRAKHVKIIIGDFYEAHARALLCEAYKMGMTPQNGYVWFLPSWFRFDWFDTNYYNGVPHFWEPRSQEFVKCDTDQMKVVVQGHFTLSTAYYDIDDTRAIGNMTVGSWKKSYKERIELKQNMSTSVDDFHRIFWRENEFAGYAYDAVWMYALALDKLLAQDASAIDSLHSGRTTAQFMNHLQATNFQGVSGQILFRGADRQGIIHVKQFNLSEGLGAYDVVGWYYPDHKPLMLEKKIKWYSGERPTDGSEMIGQEECSVESFRALLGVTCSEAIVVANVLGVGLCLLFIALIVFLIVRRYVAKVQKTRQRLEELGLMQDDHWLTLDQWELPRENVVLNRKLGQGAFGTVYGGEAMITDSWLAVAVKTLQAGSTPEEKLEFLSEAETMKRFDHDNIVILLGVCTRGEPAYAVMEFMLHGDLKTFLLSRRQLVGQDVREAEDVSPLALTKMALDVARGLDYLHENEYVHRDLACRNCLVHANKTVKIGDFGMARPMFDHGYYRFSKRGMLPVRWMAPESLLEGIFTPFSDVWSFGVLLYEIITFGSFPYQGFSNGEVLDYVRRGNTLSISAHCDDELRGLILACWSKVSEDRPTTSQITNILQQSPELLSPYLEEPIASVSMDEKESINIMPKVVSKPTKPASGRWNLPSASSISSIFNHPTQSPGPRSPGAYPLHELKRNFMHKEQCGDQSPIDDLQDETVLQSIPSLHSSQESLTMQFSFSPSLLHSSHECSPMLPRATHINDTLVSTTDNQQLPNGWLRTPSRGKNSSQKCESTNGWLHTQSQGADPRSNCDSITNSPLFSKRGNKPCSVDEKTDSDYCSDNSKEWTHVPPIDVAVV